METIRTMKEQFVTFQVPGLAHSNGSSTIILWLDSSGYLELTDSKYDWVTSYANLSKEQMAEVGRFLLEAANDK